MQYLVEIGLKKDTRVKTGGCAVLKLFETTMEDAEETAELYLDDALSINVYPIDVSNKVSIK